MVNVKWWEPLIVAVPTTLIGLSSDMMQNFGSFVGTYLIMFAVIYVLKIPFSKTVEKVDE